MNATANDDERAAGLEELREIRTEREATQAHIDRLDEARNRLILALAKDGATQVELARASGISQPAVWKILNRATKKSDKAADTDD